MLQRLVGIMFAKMITVRSVSEAKLINTPVCEKCRVN